MAKMDRPTLFFPYGFDERIAAESEQRGYFGQAIVELPNNARVKVCFYDPIRLTQDLENALESGEFCVAEPGLIVIPSVTLEHMQHAIEQLYSEGYFDSFVPLE
jgi:hypothetical protein